MTGIIIPKSNANSIHAVDKMNAFFYRQLDLRSHRRNGASCFTKIRL